MKRRGLGLLETVLAMSLLLLGLGITFALFFMGARSFYASDRQHDLHRDATLVLDRLTRLLEAAPAAAVTVEPDKLAVASCRNADGNTVLDPNGDPLWQCYYVFFAAAPELRQRKIAMTPVVLPLALPDYDAGSGPNPLAYYATDGEAIARNLAEFQCRRPTSSEIELILRLEKPAAGRQTARRLEISTLVSLRLK